MKVVAGDWASWDVQSTDVAVGVFDGVHLGHRAVLEQLGARDLTAAVLTFDPHPVAVVAPHYAPPLLTTLERRLELFEESGIEVAAVVTFDERVRAMSPASFCLEVVVGGLGAGRVVIGADFHFGKDRAGSPAVLSAIGQELGFEVVVTELVGDDGGISSSAIRSALAAGQVEQAAAWLGRDYRVSGEVVAGENRGADIGFPTANLDVAPGLAVPGRGVYAVVARIGDVAVPGVANIGIRPTFGGDGARVVEVHLLDFSADLYGTRLDIDFVARIRDEQAFRGVEELTAQIERDVAAARRIHTS